MVRAPIQDSETFYIERLKLHVGVVKVGQKVAATCSKSPKKLDDLMYSLRYELLEQHAPPRNPSERIAIDKAELTDKYAKGT